MTAFTIITGLATLIGFFLQIRGLFPEYRRYYIAATFFLFGLTVGVGTASVTGVSIQLPETISARSILGFALYAGTGLLIFVCFAATAVVADPARRSELSKIGSAVSGFLIFLLLFFTSWFFPSDSPNYLTYDEQIELVASAARKQSYDRALALIADGQKYLRKDDLRRANLDKLAAEIRAQQNALPTIGAPTPVTPSAAPKTLP